MATLPVEDGRLWYDERGTGPPLVCLHGGWQNADDWQQQVDYFADDYRVVTVDLRGHGRTGATEARHYSVDMFVDDLEALFEWLDIHNPTLLGLSLGGMVIQSYLDRHPDSARAAVIGGPLRSFPPIDIPAMMKPFVSPLPVIAGMATTLGPRATFQSLLSSVQATNGRPWLTVNSSIRSASVGRLRSVSAEEYLKIFRALYEFVPPNLADVQTPLLVLYGDHEIATVKRQAKQLADTVQNSAIREIPDSGHLVNQDAPGAFNSACSQFFRTHGS